MIDSEKLDLSKYDTIDERIKLQYFSKLYNKWIDFKITDSVNSLKKYHYKIRINPKFK